jgi:hypothetical protein
MTNLNTNTTPSAELTNLQTQRYSVTDLRILKTNTG